MSYRRIKTKTYNNVLYIAKLIEIKKGYPHQESIKIALNQFSDYDNKYNWINVETMLHSLVTYEEHKQRIFYHDFNMQGVY